MELLKGKGIPKHIKRVMFQDLGIIIHLIILMVLDILLVLNIGVRKRKEIIVIVFLELEVII
jgi:hypothetical protein